MTSLDLQQVQIVQVHFEFLSSVNHRKEHLLNALYLRALLTAHVPTRGAGTSAHFFILMSGPTRNDMAMKCYENESQTLFLKPLLCCAKNKFYTCE